jgi:hypothetical protein|tara:strand:+ start:10274 stop:12166 length:1893 start_codon:yes stop_codon:yes gene_type:complete
MSANLLELQEMLRNISMPEVQSVASGQSGKASQLLAMDEIKRRGEMMAKEKGQEAGEKAQEPPMVDQFLAASQQMMGQPAPMPPQMAQAMPPQMPPQQQGIGSMVPQAPMPQPQMPPQMAMGQPPQQMPPQMMASGGRVGFAGPGGSYVGDPQVMASLDSQYQALQNLDPEKQRYVALVREAAIANGMDPDRAVAQIMQESAFDPNAVSSAGAKGLAQFMPKTQPEVGLENPFNPEEAARAYGVYQSRINKMFPNDPARQLAAYNAGMGRVDREFGSENWDVPEADNYIARIAGLTDRIKAGQQTGEGNNSLLDSINTDPNVAPPRERPTNAFQALIRALSNREDFERDRRSPPVEDVPMSEGEKRRLQIVGAERVLQAQDLPSVVSGGEDINLAQESPAVRNYIANLRVQKSVENLQNNPRAGLSGSHQDENSAQAVLRNYFKRGQPPTDIVDTADVVLENSPKAELTDEEKAAQADLRSRQDFTLALGEQGEKDTKKRDLSGLYNAMMRGGLELASGKSIGESGIAGLESATTQARYDREQTREEAAQAFREKYGESQIRYQDARSKDLARDNAFFRTQAIESLSDNVAFTMLKPGTDEYEQMIQNEVSRLRNGSASQINTEAFSPTF